MPAGEYLNQEKTYLSAFWGTASFHHVIYLTTLEVQSVLLAEIFFVDDAWSDCMIFIFSVMYHANAMKWMVKMKDDPSWCFDNHFVG